MEIERDYDAIIEEAIPIVEAAAKIALGYFRKTVLIEMKENLTPVTIADKKTEEFLRNELTSTFSGFGLIGEEFGEEDSKAEMVWTLDPIDGTLSFLRGIPLFGTLVGLLHKGEPVGGIVVLPALGETYSSAKGSGTYCDGHQLHVSNKDSIKTGFISVGDISWFDKAGRRNVLKHIQNDAEFCRGYTDCFAHALVARGALDAMIDPGINIWDVAPLASLVEEAGGEYFDFDGKRTILSGTFVTSSSHLKEDILKIIAKSH